MISYFGQCLIASSTLMHIIDRECYGFFSFLIFLALALTVGLVRGICYRRTVTAGKGICVVKCGFTIKVKCTFDKNNLHDSGKSLCCHIDTVALGFLKLCEFFKLLMYAITQVGMFTLQIFEYTVHDQSRSFCIQSAFISYIICKLVPCKYQHDVTGIFDCFVSYYGFFLDLVCDTVLLNRCIGNVADRCQQQSKECGIVAECHPWQLAVFSAYILADTAVVSGVYFIFADF